MAQARKREWQTPHVRRAFDLARTGDVPPVVLDALASMAATIQANQEASGSTLPRQARAVHTRTDGDLFAGCVAKLQPVIGAVVSVMMAVWQPALASWLHYEAGAMESFQWLLHNALLYGMSGLALVALWPDRISRDVRLVLAWILLALIASGGLVGWLWRG